MNSHHHHYYISPSPILLTAQMGRPPCCDKANVKRGPWTPEEDAKILAYVASHGIGNWTLVPQKAGWYIFPFSYTILSFLFDDVFYDIWY